jgi:seryl-tRNA synthetase
MLDPKLLRSDIQGVAAKLSKRGYVLPVQEILDLENQRKDLEKTTQDLQNERNTRSKVIGVAKAKGEDIQPLLASVEELKGQVSLAEQQLTDLQKKIEEIALTIPNIPHDSVPLGSDEKDNVEIRSWGKIPQFDFTPKDHVELGETLKLMDFEAASKMSGARFVVLYGGLSKLQRAIGQFMLDLHVREHGYREVYVPYLVKQDSLFGTGQLPKMRDDLFHIQQSDLSLIPTAEVSVTNLVRDMIVEDSEMPLH